MKTNFLKYTGICLSLLLCTQEIHPSPAEYLSDLNQKLTSSGADIITLYGNIKENAVEGASTAFKTFTKLYNDLFSNQNPDTGVAYTLWDKLTNFGADIININKDIYEYLSTSVKNLQNWVYSSYNNLPSLDPSMLLKNPLFWGIGATTLVAVYCYKLRTKQNQPGKDESNLISTIKKESEKDTATSTNLEDKKIEEEVNLNDLTREGKYLIDKKGNKYLRTVSKLVPVISKDKLTEAPLDKTIIFI